MATAKKKPLEPAGTGGTSAAVETGVGRSGPDTGSKPVLKQKVLVAEDNKVTQDLLKLLLKQRGHEVDIVADGQAALEALKREHYDVVLMDFHLPKLDGLKVATAFRSGKALDHSPRFVAITADTEGLLGHVDNCENFDGVLPKPFNLERVVQVVEGRVEEVYVPAEAPQLPADVPGSTQADIPPGPSIDHIHDLKHEFLRWPDDFDGNRLSARLLQAMLDDAGRFDAVLVREQAGLQDLSALWSTKALHVLPVIDLSGTLGRHADLDGTKLSVGETDAVADLIGGFHSRRARLHADVLYSDDLGVKILGRTYVTGKPLTAGYDPASRDLISYNLTLDSDIVVAEAAKLCTMGYFDRQFFDRFHQCGACGSSRLHVREECSECRSSDLHEEAYLHHFGCAYQGPESDFRRGDDLVCPKCRRELAHFGVDYDKPGSMMKCGNCAHADSEPMVGFVCLDCHAHAGSETLTTRDAYSYEPTDRGIGYVETARAMLGRQQNALRLSQLPLEVIVAVNNELKAYQADGTPFAVLDIAYGNERRIEHENGVREFEQARDLFLENLNNTLRRDDLVIKGISYDYAILKGVDPKEARDGIDYLRTEAGNAIRHDLGVTIQVFTAEDFV